MALSVRGIAPRDGQGVVCGNPGSGRQGTGARGSARVSEHVDGRQAT